ncbi:hypothetical protein KIN20_015571 [Parelaphostrongylus tenuis]|uniref:Uncharacterized protein n=1 Tax=Parelaphostrongylus tenuis TaxID=148309 RepID=A0AAD5QCG5_PARTN|nr:hypothetical protein KIN20_001667 [Parelaphostrongylus tenuis]KAJ1357427.1 hypothetical protein KIN20_015571 [Parelaphostrongylus tenuis]
MRTVCIIVLIVALEAVLHPPETKNPGNENAADKRSLDVEHPLYRPHPENHNDHLCFLGLAKRSTIVMVKIRVTNGNGKNMIGSVMVDPEELIRGTKLLLRRVGTSMRSSAIAF